MLADLILLAAFSAQPPSIVTEDGVILRTSPEPLRDERVAFMVRRWAEQVTPTHVWRGECLGDKIEISARADGARWDWSLSRAGTEYSEDIVAVFNAEFGETSITPGVRYMTCDGDALGVAFRSVNSHVLPGFDDEDPERPTIVHEVLETVIWIERGRASVRLRVHLGGETIGPDDLRRE